jgi:transcriptional regulator with XRE-family HTH domain
MRMTGDAGQNFGAVLRRLRLERGLSQERLAFAMHDAGQPGATSGAIGQFERGVTRPRPATIEAIAAALRVDPSEFAEYRLYRLRSLFDEREVGLDQALANAAELAQALTEDGIPAPPPGELRRLLTDALPMQRDPEQQPTRRGSRARSRRTPPA